MTFPKCLFFNISIINIRSLIVLLISISFILLSPELVQAEWSQDAGDANRSGSTGEDPLTPWTWIWSFNGPDPSGGTGGHIYDAPKEARTITGGGLLYAPGGNNGLYALNLTSGTQVWNVKPAGFGAFNAAPAYHAGTNSVIIGGSGGTVYKISAVNGSVLGSLTLNGGVNKAILIQGDYAYAVTANGYLYKIAVSNMTSVWANPYSSGSVTQTPPTFSTSRNVIIFATGDLFIHAVNDVSGSLKWKVKPTPNTPGFPNEFENAWPVVAEKHGIVLIRLRIKHEAMFAYPGTNATFPNTNSAIRTYLDTNKDLKNLFALSLDTGNEAFTPAVGYGTTEDLDPVHSTVGGAYGVMGSQPVVKVWPNGDEVVYIHFRNGQSNPPDFRWDSQAGEMVLDNTTVPGLVAGDLRFIRTSRYNGYGGSGYDHITDEQTPFSMAGSVLFNSHWAATTSHRITNRSTALGLAYSTPIETSKNPPVIRALYNNCSNKVISTHYTTCTNLNYVTDGNGSGGRYFDGPGFWIYWGVPDPPGWKIGSNNTAGSSYSAGFLPRYTYVSNGYIVVEGNGGDISVFKHSGTSVTPTAGPSPTAAPTVFPTNTPSPIPSPTPTITPSGLPGDANGDGKVDITDMVKWLNGYVAQLSGIFNGDFDGNGKTDGRDYVIWLNNFKPALIVPTPTPTSASGTNPAAALLKIGSGVTDVIPHQIVRTANYVYIFAPNLPGSTTLNAVWAAGFPATAADFAATNKKQTTLPARIISADSVFDGTRYIHIIANLGNGAVVSTPFDTQTNTFLTSSILATDGNGSFVDIGTSGISGAMDNSSPKQLQIAYYNSANKIIHTAYIYNSATNTYSTASSVIQISGSESANHPVIAVSPLDNSVTVAWVGGTDGAGNIYSRTKTGNIWGSQIKVNSADVWTSPNAGLNIDQGPSLVISADGIKHLVYIENWRTSIPYDYGRIHYCTGNGSSWSDTFINSYSHDPAIAVKSNGDLYILGHGHPQSTTSVTGCKDENNLCVAAKLSGAGSWSEQKLISAAINQNGITYGFDSSPSVKWSAVGWNSPDLIEYTIFTTENNSYANTSIWYGRF